jgi:carboxymethylenebutenolidase
LLWRARSDRAAPSPEVAALAAAAAHSAAARVRKEESPMSHELSGAKLTQLSLPLEDGALPLRVARASGGGAGIAIFPSAFGVGADLAEQMSELAQSARAVATFDPFWRGDAGFARTGEMPRVMARMSALDRVRAGCDYGALVRWLRESAGCRAVIALGICFGGPFAFGASAEGDVDGVVTWHGTALGQQLARAAEMRCPLRLHFGGADPFVPLAEVDAIRAAFAAHADAEIALHPGATHGFSHRAVPEAYQPAAERAAMRATHALARQLA